MNPTRALRIVPAAILLLALAAGCSDRDPTELDVARAPIDPVVFDDDYSADVYFQAFLDTHVAAVSRDSVYAVGGDAVDGARSLKVTVPPDASSLGTYSGGVLTAAGGRDLADFNALTFWARCSRDILLDVAGFGNDNTGTSRYEAGRANIPLGYDWTCVVIPIPRPSRLISERGLFTFAEGTESPDRLGYDIWFDEIRFAKVDGVTDPRPFLPSSNKQYFIGSTASLDGTFTVFRIDGAFAPVNHMPGYFDFTSTDPSVAAVQNGAVRIVGQGSAVVTASLDGVAASGSVSLTGFPPPTEAAVPPTLPAADVISMFSDVYADRPVDSWNPRWGGSTTDDADYVVAGDNTKMYSSLNYVGIDFATRTVDVTGMDFLHLDVFAPAGTNFRVKLVVFSGDGGDLVDQRELTFDAASTPAFAAGAWSPLDIPLADFGFAVPLDHVGQIVVSTDDARLVLLDNIYWHR